MQPRQSIPSDAAAVMQYLALSVKFSRIPLSWYRLAWQVAWQGPGTNATWVGLYRWPRIVSTEFCVCPIHSMAPAAHAMLEIRIPDKRTPLGGTARGTTMAGQ